MQIIHLQPRREGGRIQGGKGRKGGSRERGSRLRGNVRVGLRPESHRKIVDLHVTPITQALIINTTNSSPSRKGRREDARRKGKEYRRKEDWERQ